ncbi:MAG TPA: Ig-like domain-containing protein [Thermoleophilaceae bacterium]|nr:Ig-like domain-containing protein [Thermoleophilaceae bacterium]
MVAQCDPPGARKTLPWGLLPLLVVLLLALTAGDALAAGTLRVNPFTTGSLRQVVSIDGDGAPDGKVECGSLPDSPSGACYVDYADTRIPVPVGDDIVITPTVTLKAATAVTPPGWAFHSWTGCAPDATVPSICTVLMNGDKNVIANFEDVGDPVVDLTDPGGTSVRGTKGLSAFASDGQSGLSKVEFRADGIVVGTVTPPCLPTTNCGIGVSWDTTTVPDGPVTIDALAYDRADVVSSSILVPASVANVTLSSPRTVTVDNTAPVTTITSPSSDDSTTTATTMTVAFAADGPATFACRTYRAGDAPPVFGPCSAAGSHTVSGLTPGAQAFEVRATDAVGNASVARRSWTVVTLGGNTGGTGGNTGGTGGNTTTLTTPTGLGLSFAKQKLRRALSKGFVAKAGCAQACLVSSRLVLSGKLAKKLKLSKKAKATVVAKGSALAPAGGKGQLKLKFTKKAKKAFKRLRSIKLSLVSTPSSSGGAGAKKTLSVTLKR